jgi:hypothetical protein
MAEKLLLTVLLILVFLALTYVVNYLERYKRSKLSFPKTESWFLARIHKRIYTEESSIYIQNEEDALDIFKDYRDSKGRKEFFDEEWQRNLYYSFNRLDRIKRK